MGLHANEGFLKDTFCFDKKILIDKILYSAINAPVALGSLNSHEKKSRHRSNSAGVRAQKGNVGVLDRSVQDYRKATYNTFGADK